MHSAQFCREPNTALEKKMKSICLKIRKVLLVTTTKNEREGKRDEGKAEGSVPCGPVSPGGVPRGCSGTGPGCRTFLRTKRQTSLCPGSII